MWPYQASIAMVSQVVFTAVSNFLAMALPSWLSYSTRTSILSRYLRLYTRSVSTAVPSRYLRPYKDGQVMTVPRRFLRLWKSRYLRLWQAGIGIYGSTKSISTALPSWSLWQFQVLAMAIPS